MWVWQFILFITLITLGIHKVGACDCSVVSTNEQAFEQADLIFKGKVVQVKTHWISGGWKYYFSVEKSWKRSTENFLSVNTPLEKDCGYVFEEGKTYLVYVKKGFNMETDACMGSLLWEEAELRLPQLGQSYETAHSPLFMYTAWAVGGLSLLATLFLAYIIFHKRKK